MGECYENSRTHFITIKKAFKDWSIIYIRLWIPFSRPVLKRVFMFGDLKMIVRRNVILRRIEF